MVMTMEEVHGKMALLVGLENVRFRKPVMPGDALITEAEMIWLRRDVGRVKTTARVEQEIVAEAEIVFALVEPTRFRREPFKVGGNSAPTNP